jgi:hypothetical protein
MVRARSSARKSCVFREPVSSAACCLLPAACCLLPAACCLLPAACCLLPAACCLPPAACRLLPANNQQLIAEASGTLYNQKYGKSI